MPKVSVVVATYRREAALQRALESLAAQTYGDFEIILVDDNANAEWNRKVKEIAGGFRERHPQAQIRLIVNNPNQGSARTRNTGIEAAGGEYVCFLDDDDIYLPERIRNQLAPMERENADYSITDIALYSEAEKLIEVRTRGYAADAAPDGLLRLHLMYHMTGTDTMMFRRDYLIRIGGFSAIDSGDEFYLMQKAIEAGGKFLYVPACDVKAYVHAETGLSSGSGKIAGENVLFEHKKKYFAQLKPADVRYIRMRHYAVLAYAYLRAKRYWPFLLCGVKAMAAAPAGAIRILTGRK